MCLMRDNQRLDTDLKKRSESIGNRSRISIRRSSSDTTVCTDEGSSLSVTRFPELMPSSPVTTSEPSGSSEKDPGMVSMKKGETCKNQNRVSNKLSEPKNDIKCFLGQFYKKCPK